MKQADLRAAAHNIADSLSGEFSFVLGIFQVPVWDAVDASPSGEVTLDLLRGEVIPEACDEQLHRAIEQAALVLPEFLRKHSCDPDQVTKLEMVLRRGNHREFPTASAEGQREVIVTVAQQDGTESTDRYVGMPLTRPRKLDALGRLRTERKARKK